MVYLEEQSSFLRTLLDTPLAPLLNEYLNAEAQPFSNDIHNASNMALDLLICIKANNKEKAEQIFSQFSKRQPTEDSDWIYDNYVIFAVVCASRKFSLSQSWARSIIDLSYNRMRGNGKKIRDTYKNILSGNLNVNGDFHQLSVVYQYLTNEENYDLTSLNRMFGALWRQQFPFFEEDFLNIMSLIAIKVAFLQKGLLSDQERFEAYSFLPILKARINKAAGIIAVLIILFLAVGTFYALWQINLFGEKNPEFGKGVSFLLSIIGIGLMGFLKWHSKIRTQIVKIIKYILGYKTYH